MKQFSRIKKDPTEGSNHDLIFEFYASSDEDDPSGDLHAMGLWLAESGPTAHTPDIPYRGLAYSPSGTRESLVATRLLLAQKGWTQMSSDREEVKE